MVGELITMGAEASSAVCLLLPPAGEFPTLAPLEGGFVDGRIAHRSNQRSLKSH